MVHDNDDKCKQFNSDKKSQHVMEMALGFSANPWSWSNCSRQFLTSFLEWVFYLQNYISKAINNVQCKAKDCDLASFDSFCGFVKTNQPIIFSSYLNSNGGGKCLRHKSRLPGLHHSRHKYLPRYAGQSYSSDQERLQREFCCHNVKWHLNVF